jgi:hypothetical protein
LPGNKCCEQTEGNKETQGNARHNGRHLWSQLLGRLGQEDRLSPQVPGQLGQHSEIPISKRKENKIKKEKKHRIND